MWSGKEFATCEMCATVNRETEREPSEALLRPLTVMSFSLPALHRCVTSDVCVIRKFMLIVASDSTSCAASLIEEEKKFTTFHLKSKPMESASISLSISRCHIVRGGCWHTLAGDKRQNGIELRRILLRECREIFEFLSSCWFLVNKQRLLYGYCRTFARVCTFIELLLIVSHLHLVKKYIFIRYSPCSPRR